MTSQEPWCFDPDKIARLTDWQIENLYYKPALEREKEFKKNSPQVGERASPTSHAPQVDDEPPKQMAHPKIGTPAFRYWYIAKMGPYVGGPKAAAALFDEQMKQYKDLPPDKWWNNVKKKK